jgi:hypothetical protein
MTDAAEIPDELRGLAEGYTAAWCGGDPARVASFYEQGGSLTVNGAAPAVGREAIAEVARGFMTAFPHMRVVMDGLSAGDEGIIYRWTLTGTNTGPGGTGREVCISGREVWRIGEGGLIAESHGHFDEEEYLRQVGNEDTP